MEPQEIEPHLLNNALRQLIYFTGLDLSTNPQHSAIFNAFVNKTGERSSTAVHYKMLTAGSELFTSCSRSMSSSVDSGARASSPLFTSAELSGSTALPARSGVMAMVKRRWPLKYLEDRPALIVNFVDLDWDHTAWLEKRAECESKINALRQSIGQRETKLALVLIQRQKAASMDEPMANEKALELCQHCRLNSRLLFVFPRLSDERALKERVNRLEKAFHGIAQEFYQACFKRIRSRNVPNNDAHLLVRQQFKLAFISELREDRHSALRYYKQAYQIGHELDVSDVDVYEHCSVASLLNYKICELNFVLNSAVEREPTFYPSRELAAIELAWWKAQQCRLFAELFNRAVSNGLAAYPSQNPGRFLGEAATHHKRANAMIRALRAKLATTAPQRQTSQLAGDPLQSFDLSTPTTFYGQRPWRLQPFLANSAAAKAPKLPPLSSVNQQLLEHGAKLFLENNVRENYAQSLQLLSAAVAQFKRYGCERFANLWLFDMAEEYIAAQQFAKALQILRRLVMEDKNVTFYPFLRETLVAVANAAFCALSLNEWAGALFQLLHPQLANSSIRSYASASLSSADENHQGLWMENFGHFLSGENCVPFPLLSSANEQNSLGSNEELNSLRHQWHQLLDHQQKAQFQLDMGDLSHSPIQFCAHFLVVGVADALQTKLDDADDLSSFFGDVDSDTKIASAGDPILIEVVLHNISQLPLQFERCSLVLEEISQTSDAKIAKTLSDWITADNLSKNSAFALFPGRPLRVFFVYKTALALSLQQLTQMSSTALNRSQSPLSESPRELLLAILDSALFIAFAVRVAQLEH
uniref:Trafficking protein particle complex subunit 11 domain-containing protein n=1 Tax=Globodera rostochiensis TaxID=31243 RepID=A0A914GRR5_GLORO